MRCERNHPDVGGALPIGTRDLKIRGSQLTQVVETMTVVFGDDKSTGDQLAVDNGN
jgi:hypothetical protein